MKRTDVVLAVGMLATVLLALVALTATGSLDGFLSWVWARHHNELSWYVRPLFLLPFCYFAYRRSVLGIVVTLLLFPTSLFWFPAPENPSPRVEEYLAWERHFLTEGSVLARVVLLLLVVAFFVALSTPFWKRSGRLIRRIPRKRRIVRDLGCNAANLARLSCPFLRHRAQRAREASPQCNPERRGETKV